MCVLTGSRAQPASETVGSRSRLTGHRAGGLPNALRALRTIFLPAIRLPTAPMTAPIPTGRILPTSSALRRSVNRRIARLSNREFNCDKADSGREATPSARHAPLGGAPPADQFGHRLLAVVADQHREHQGASPLPVFG